MQFKSFNIKTELISVLEKLGYTNLTKIQEIVIPKALKGENIIAKSETGSGKTHSFLVPIINNVIPESKIQAIIVSVNNNFLFLFILLNTEPEIIHSKTISKIVYTAFK